MRKFLVGLAILAVAGFCFWQFSPWPSALFYRYLFDKGGIAMNDALAKHVPDGVITQTDLAYGQLPVEKLDVYLPARTSAAPSAFPTIFWIHGGGFISGDKNQIANYLKILAASGYAVIGINYTLAPSAQHPTPTRQANAALAYIKANAEKLNIDDNRIILAGDSAGSQIAAQLGIAIVDPAYAKALDIVPAIKPSALRGLVLHCGIYDPNALNASGAMGGFLKTVAWSYFGTTELDGPAMPQQFSIVSNLPPTMPPLFITAGNADPLLPHSVSLADVASRAGIQVDSLFFPADYKPPLQHEYEFDLDHEAGQQALQRSLKFVSEHTQ